MNSATMQFGLIQRIKSIFRLPTKPQLVAVSATPKLYRSIHDLPLTIFIDCQCEQKYDGLVLQGSPTNTEISEAWADLLQQYTELIGGSEVIDKIKNLSQIIKLENRLQNIEKLLQLIVMIPNEKMYNLLFIYGYSLPKLPFSEQNIEKVLKVFMGHYKLDRTKYKMLTANKQATKQTIQPKQTRNDFVKMLSRVAIAFKLPTISISSITTAEYCNYVNEYRAHCESIEKENQKLRNK